MARPAARHLRRRRGFTLLELMIAMSLTLILVYAMAQFYAYVAETVRDGRAQIEMGNSMRAAVQRLQDDFKGLTVKIGARVNPGAQQGHFEIWEGLRSDMDADGNGTPDVTDVGDLDGDGKADAYMLGDFDDYLSMTVHSTDEPFVGRWWGPDASGNYDYRLVRSNVAEVIWFTTFKDLNNNTTWEADEPRFLVRRQLLIRPDLTISWPNAPNGLPSGETIFHHNDISCHVTASAWVANSLADLSQRENRFIHINFSGGTNGLVAAQGYMPNPVQLNCMSTDPANNAFTLYSLDGPSPNPGINGNHQFQGEDKLLSNVLSFDVRVYDPFAPLRADNTDMTQSTVTTDDDAQGALSPGDPGYATAVLGNFPILGRGAYVDLWYTRAFQNYPQAQRDILLQASNSAYAWSPNARSNPGGALWPFPQWATWDSWTTAYENDGLDQFSDGQTDWMVDGLDNNSSLGVDDPTEQETRPPYPSRIGDNGVDDNFDLTADDTVETNAAIYPPLPNTTLRGVQVRIRMYEPGTRQTRQATVGTDFIPE